MSLDFCHQIFYNTLRIEMEGAMDQLETRFSQVEVLPMVMHYMDELDLTNLFEKNVPAEPGNITSHAESLCILTANIICDRHPDRLCVFLNPHKHGRNREHGKRAPCLRWK